MAGRLLREFELAGLDEVVCSFGDNASLPMASLADARRLAPGIRIHAGDFALASERSGRVVEFDSRRLVAGSTLRAFLESGCDELHHAGELVARIGEPKAEPEIFETDAALRLDRIDAGMAILRQTVKPLDGLVSRRINRPISRRISRFLLRLPAVRPWHATVVTALIGLAMFTALVSGQSWSLVAGGLLYQFASMFDGVDGEIARATFRSSRSGAMLDSLTDTATNFAFLLGLTIIAGRTGPELAFYCGIGVLALLPLGLLIIGFHVSRLGEPLSFDLLKRGRIARKGVNAWQKWVSVAVIVSSRDVYALAFSLLAIAGLLAPILVLYALALALWLGAVVYLLLIKREPAEIRG